MGDNVNNKDIDEKDKTARPSLSTGAGRSVKTTSPRRPLRATMSLTNFDQDESGRTIVGNSVESKSTVATPEEFVAKLGGKRVINKILIANNGIAGKSF